MKTKRILIITIATIFIILLGTNISNGANLYLNKLDFDAKINSDGTMDVTEIWKISIDDTNTLFKTFETDRSKYSGITNVKVKDFSDNKEFSQIYEEMYHVTKGSYYGLNKSSGGDFEIAWGVSIDSRQTKIYEISYTVNDVVAKYNDCAELYWQFVGDQFEIDADKITGTVTLPEDAVTPEDIKVWGHTENLNGEIYVTGNNKVTFQIDNYESGKMVEVRIAMPIYMFDTVQRTYNKDMLESIIEEETIWAEEANARREAQEKATRTIGIIILIADVCISIFLLTKTIKYIKFIRENKKIKPTTKLDYYRDLPYETATPGEAVFVGRMQFYDFYSTMGSLFSATLLNLNLKKCININIREEEKNKKDKIEMELLNNENINNLKEEEKVILEFLKKACKGETSITIKKLEKFIANKPLETKELNKKMHEAVKKEEKEMENYNEENAKLKTKYFSALLTYFVLSIFFVATIRISCILLFINFILTIFALKKINVLTQKGVDEREQWNALEKYMKDFSLLKEKEVLALVIWEKYLVFATAFGIADKVLKQLKIVYPEFNDMVNSTAFTTLYLMNNSSFSNTFSSSINSSFSSTYSSGGGRRWRILWRWWRSAGGGGGRRRSIRYIKER